MNVRHPIPRTRTLASATRLVFALSLLLSLLPQQTFAVSVQSSRLPHPFQFTENRGQWDSAVLYKCEVRRDGFTWFLERDGVTLVTSVIDSTKPIDASRGGSPHPPASFDPLDRNLLPRYALKSHALKFKFVDSRRGEPQSARRRQSHSPLSDQDAPTNMGAFAPTGRMRYAPTDKCTTQEDVGINSDLPFAQAKWIDTQGELSWHNNYFLGNDSSKWAPDCRNFTRVVYHDVWNGIDVEWYESKGHLEFDFVVHPGADPKQIKMVCEGLDAPIAGGGRTLLSVDSINSITNRSRTGVSDLRLSNELSLPISLGELRMTIPGAYQTTVNGARGNAVTAQFRLLSENLFAIDLPNGYDASQTLRIDPLVYSTYLGGSSMDYIYAATGLSDGLVVTGSTEGQGFPLTPGCLDSITYNTCCFVTKITESGSQLLYSTFLNATSANAICNDGFNGVIITGYTRDNSLPVTNLSSYRGVGFPPINNAFITRFSSSGSQLIFSTYLGGSTGDSTNYTGDVGSAIVNDGLGGCFVAGYTNSYDFPVTTGVFDTSYNGGSYDCFAAHVNNLATLLYSTYLGGNGYDCPSAILKCNDNSIIVSGWTSSDNLPTTPSAYSSVNSGGMDGFISHLSAIGTQLVSSTYFGGSLDDGVSDLIRDSNRNVVVAGSTGSTNFPVTPGSFDTTLVQGSACFVSRLDSTLSHVLTSTFLGDSGTNSASKILIDNYNALVVTGQTSSNSFPITTDAFQSFYGGGLRDCFISRLNIDCSQIFYSSFLGGSGIETPYGLCIDNSNNILVCGFTRSPNFPNAPASIDSSLSGSRDGFITSISGIITSVPAFSVPLLTNFSLSQNYPNPFNATTTLSYSLPKSGFVELKLFDLTGREISSFVQRNQTAGTYRLQIDGSRLASGTYFVRLQAGAFSKTQKIVLLK